MNHRKKGLRTCKCNRLGLAVRSRLHLLSPLAAVDCHPGVECAANLPSFLSQPNGAPGDYRIRRWPSGPPTRRILRRALSAVQESFFFRRRRRLGPDRRCPRGFHRLLRLRFRSSLQRWRVPAHQGGGGGREVVGLGRVDARVRGVRAQGKIAQETVGLGGTFELA